MGHNRFLLGRRDHLTVPNQAGRGVRMVGVETKDGRHGRFPLDTGGDSGLE